MIIAVMALEGVTMSKVFFECDRRKCLNCSYPLCRHTEDIEHAEHFKNECSGYYEKIDDFRYSVKHGHWETIGGGIFVKGDSYAVRFKCSICGHFVNLGTDRNYCPNCGAKMDGERKDDAGV